MRHIAIIGGGASGLAAAITCARLHAQRGTGVKVSVFEAGPRVGASIMRSGNGRCNFTNAHIDVSRYHGSQFVSRAKAAVAADARIPGVLSWFADLGLVWGVPTSDGLMYPLSNKANSVLDVLRLALERYGVKVHVETPVHRVERVGDAFRLDLGGGVTQRADAVVLAVGGVGVAQVELPFVKVGPQQITPLLAPLACDRAAVRGLDGIRVNARVELPARDFVEAGEVLFREYGVSGIVIFNASRYARPGDKLVLDLMPSINVEQLEMYFTRKADQGAASVEELCAGLAVGPVARAVARAVGVNDKVIFQQPECTALAEGFKHFQLKVEGLGATKNAQVHRGGFAAIDFDPATMRHRSVPGFYVTGEALDVDGPCGGYNLDWAWTSGILAGTALGRLSDVFAE